MYHDQVLGKLGEEIATNYLQEKGYQILERNYRSRFGEIDIIAKQKKEFVFVEVKTRMQKRYGSPAEAITKQKKKHIYRTAEYYVMKNHLEESPIRFDVIEIMCQGERIIINQMINANF